MPSTTYKLNWNLLKKGSLIKIPTDNNRKYRVLSLAADGTAEIVPLQHVGSPGTSDGMFFSQDTSNISRASGISGLFRGSNGNQYYGYSVPLDTGNTMSGGDIRCNNSPLANYLLDTTAYSTFGTNSSGIAPSNATYTFSVRRELTTSRYYKLRADTSSANHKGRPLVIDDCKNYFGDVVDASELSKLTGLNNCLGDGEPCEGDAPRYADQFVEDLNADGYGTYLIPVFKINLAENGSIWTLEKEA